MKKIISKFLDKMGYEIIKKSDKVKPDMDKEFQDFYAQCEPYTMTSVERMYMLYKSIEYIANNKIEGDFVECGVWKGGSSMMAALALKKFGAVQKKMYLYDTFEGMSEPTVKDISFNNEKMIDSWGTFSREEKIFCLSPIDEVKSNLAKTGYDPHYLFYIQGKVEDTIPATMPDKISLLRLDTDWYESTKHEMLHLYPHLVNKGVLILDDYGHWKGAREAVDEYFADRKTYPLLGRIDYTGRLFIKTD